MGREGVTYRDIWGKRWESQTEKERIRQNQNKRGERKLKMCVCMTRCVCSHGNLQCGQLSHVVEGVWAQCTDAVVAQVSVQIETYSDCTQTNTHIHLIYAYQFAKLAAQYVYSVQGYVSCTYTNDSCFRPTSSLGTDVSILPSRYLQRKVHS